MGSHLLEPRQLGPVEKDQSYSMLFQGLKDRIGQKCALTKMDLIPRISGSFLKRARKTAPWGGGILGGFQMLGGAREGI